jgi:hypothetical protein
MLLSFEPLSLIPFPIRPCHLACSVSHVELEFAYVDTAVWKCKLAGIMHFSVPPTTSIATTVGPLIRSLAVELVILKVPLVLALIRPHKMPNPALLSIQIITLKPRSFGPGFDAESAVLISLPIPLIRGALACSVLSITFYEVIDHVTFIHVAIRQNLAPDSVREIVTPVPFKNCPVCLVQRPAPLLLGLEPFPMVDRVIFYDYWRSHFELVGSGVLEGLELERAKNRELVFDNFAEFWNVKFGLEQSFDFFPAGVTTLGFL